MSARDVAQLNAKIDRELKARFDAELVRSGGTQREVVEQLIDAWILERENRGTHHLDGSECPLSKLLTGLANEVRRQRA